MPVLKLNGPSGDWGLYYEVIEKAVPYNTVFLHGNLSSHRWFLPSLEHIHSKKGKAILLDWRGCGKTTPPKNEADMSVEQLAKDVNSLLDKLGIESCNMVGHSTGGLIGLECVSQKPERYKRLLLLDSVGPKGVTFDPSMEDFFNKMANDDELAGQVVGGTILGLDFNSDFYKKVVKPDAYVGARNIGLMLLKNLSRFNAEDRYRKIKNETLIVHGQEDKIIPLTDAELLSRVLSNSRLRILEQQGHCTNVENPAKFADIMETYFNG